MAAPIPSREARPATAAWNVAKTLFQTAIFWSTLLFVVPALIYWVEGATGLGAYRFAATSWRVAGTVVFALGGALGLTSGLIMAIRGRGTPLPLDCTRELVVVGPYRYVRNPMAIAGLGQGAAVGLYLGSPSVLAYVLAGLLIWNFGVRPGEEADLEARFGEAYRAYRSRVRCWRPRLRAYDSGRDRSAVAAERTAPPGRHVLLYDGHCRFCQRQVGNLSRLAAPGAIDIVSFQDPGVLDRFPGIPARRPARRAMQLVTPDGRVYSGFEAAARAVATRPVLGLIAYSYYLPGIRLACDLAYAGVAAHRYRLMGQIVEAGGCEGGTCDLHAGGRSHS